MKTHGTAPWRHLRWRTCLCRSGRTISDITYSRFAFRDNEPVRGQTILGNKVFEQVKNFSQVSLLVYAASETVMLT